MRDQLTSIQILRAVAAFMVLAFHVAQSWSEDLGLVSANLFPMGADGVDIFFVISGFIMCYTTEGDRRSSPADFASKRLSRILPLYWGLTLAVFAVAVVAPGLLSSTSSDPIHLIKSLFFVPYARDDGGVYPLLFLGWTLNYEMFFYAVFTLALFAGRWAHALVVAVMVLMAIAGFVVRPEGVAEGFYTDNVILAFVWGCLLHAAWRRWPQAFRHAWPLLVLGFGLLMFQNFQPLDLPRAVGKGLPSLLIVAGALGVRMPESAAKRAAVSMGDASYSIYLLHPFVVELAAKLLILALGMSWLTGGLLLGLSLAGTAILGWGLYQWWERPTHTWLRNQLSTGWRQPRPAVSKAAAPHKLAFRPRQD